MLFVPYVIVAIAATLFAVTYRKDEREPDYVPYGYPIIGHMIGLLKNGVSFYETMRDKAKRPIYTIRLLRKKVYVVTSPSLISQLNKQSTTISAHVPFINLSFGKILGLDQIGIQLLLQNLHDAKPGRSLRHDILRMQHTLFKPGYSMKQMYLRTAAEFANRLAHFATDAPAQVNLLSMLKGQFVLAVASALYGPHNPFEVNPSLVEDLWTFEDGVMMLVLNIFPSITASKQLQARQRLLDGFKDYHQECKTMTSNDVPDLVNRMDDLAHRYQCTDEFMARAELGEFIGVVINAGPTLFWLVTMIASNPNLLCKIREEIDQSAGKNATGQRVIDIESAKVQCPLLVSTFQEVMRLTVISIATFAVQEDTELDGKYLLKKGAVIQVPSLAIHTDPEVWGPDAAEFVPDRFVERKKPHPAAFRSFGGGVTLCPGRFFAADIIITMAMLILSSFDFDQGEWTGASMDRSKIGTRMGPVEPAIVTLSRKKEYESPEWAFT